MTPNGDKPPCYCGRPSKGKSRYCSASCRAKISHAKNYVKRGAAVAFVPKPRDPAKRAERDRWRRLLNELKTMGYDRAREVVRLELARLAIEEL